MSFILPNSVLLALSSLNEAGYEAFLVGGSVRDYLRGVIPHDFDITTSATPTETLSVFSSYRTVKTGIKHGTITVLIEDMPLEITTYRIDGDYRDRRRPDSVSFTRNLCEDLSRRDFTINAMAYHPKEGIIDLFGGKKDLEKGLIRAVGDAEVRFEEDALRILRAFRFSSVLGFSLEEKTEAAAIKKAENLSAVSQERIREELCKLLLGKACDAVLRRYSSILSLIVPAWEDPSPISHLPLDLSIRLAALMARESPDRVKETLSALRFDNRTQKEVLSLCVLSSMPLPLDKPSVRRFLFSFGQSLVERFLLWQKADGTVGADAAKALLDEVLAAGDCYSVSHLAIGGDELLGLCRGPLVGRVLSACLFAVIEDAIPNEKGALLAFSKAFLEKGIKE